MSNELEQLKTRVKELETLVGRNLRPNEYVFNKNVRFDTGVKIIGGIYPGAVTGSGGTTFLPAGWTATKNTTGKYTVTHNLGHTRYTVVMSPSQNIADEHDVSAKTSTTFSVELLLSGSFADCPFNFMLMIY